MASQQFLGFTVTGDLGFLKYDLDWLFGQQNGGNSGAFATATQLARNERAGLGG